MFWSLDGGIKRLSTKYAQYLNLSAAILRESVPIDILEIINFLVGTRIPTSLMGYVDAFVFGTKQMSQTRPTVQVPGN